MAGTPLLFLIADTGGGHRASATAVAKRLEEAYPGEYTCHIVDAFAKASPWLIGRAADLYEPIVRHAPWFWGALYHSTNSRGAVAALRAAALRTAEPGISKLLTTLSPAAVVSFHPLLNHVAARAIRNRPGPRIPLVTVITDLVDVHASWTCPDADAVVTPSPDGHAACLGAGIAPERCYELGLAVDASFICDEPGDGRIALRQRLGLDDSRMAVLLCGGAVGSGGLVSRARALAASGADIDLVVVCGRNARAAAKLSGLCDRRGRRVTVLGFVDNMAEWMRACDLLVTKAGPGAIAEALCCGVPLLISSFLPGQERGNVDWVVRSGAGRYTPTVEGLVAAVEEIAATGHEALAPMRAAVRAAARPQATAAIADLLVGFANAPR